MATAVLVYSTCPDVALAERIGRTLVAERLAACVNILPGMHAIYRWQDKVEDATETVLLVKTRAERAEAVVARIIALHVYDEPCVLVMPISGGSASYLTWLLEAST